ncbi:MAG TPA: hypothetical protein VEI82_06710, partial [Myxococcota bacterium]|nr:hypothetical protein [Myxococcota bacterium]
MPAVIRCRAGRSLILLAAFCWTLAGAQRAAAFDIGSAPYYGSFGLRAPNPAGFLGTLTVEDAVHDSDGYVYVTETTRVSKFDRDGNIVLTWFCNQCYGITVSQATGDVFVTQSGNTVTEFTPTGSVVRTFGSSGSGNGQFSVPHG